MSELSQEDNLRLNVLLASKPQAIRIDESKMLVYGLSDAGEARVTLNPNCRDEQYLRWVREVISGHVLGSPGGYPVYLKRWTRMGQAREQKSLDQLLLLGEPEAIVAAVHADGLTAEQARRAWWAMPTADNARRMLEKPAVLENAIGRVLADFLLEFLPFEEEPRDMYESVRLVLQPGLLSDEEQQNLWRRGRTKTVYYLGFLVSMPDALPEPATSRDDHAIAVACLSPLAEAGNPVAALLQKCLSAEGQTYLRLVQKIMKKPANQEVVNVLLDTVAAYFGAIGLYDCRDIEIETICAFAEQEASLQCADDTLALDRAALAQVLEVLPAARTDICAMLVLARIGFPVVRPVFAKSSAIGTLMRKKLEPMFAPILSHIDQLLRSKYEA